MNLFGLDVKIEENFAAVIKAVDKATERALRIAAFAIRRTAIESVETAAGPSAPGAPPHTRRGLLRRAIIYDVDRAAQTAVIGPRFSAVGEAMQAHEFGGSFRGDNYPARPFMGPALEDNLNEIPALWQGEVTN